MRRFVGLMEPLSDTRSSVVSARELGVCEVWAVLRWGLGETKPLTLAKAEDKAMVCAVGIERFYFL